MKDCFGSPGAAGIGSNINAAYKHSDSVISAPFTGGGGKLYSCPSYVERLQALSPIPMGRKNTGSIIQTVNFSYR